MAHHDQSAHRGRSRRGASMKSLQPAASREPGSGPVLERSGRLGRVFHRARESADGQPGWGCATGMARPPRRGAVFRSPVAREHKVPRVAGPWIARAKRGRVSMAIENMTLLGPRRGGSRATGARRSERIWSARITGSFRVPSAPPRPPREAVGWMALESSAWRRIR